MIPPLAEGFIQRRQIIGLETLLSGAAVVLVPGPGAAGVPAGRTQCAVWVAGELWRAGAVELLAWVDASSRASVLAGYLQVARRLGLDFGESAEVSAVRVHAWLCSSPRRWLLVLDGLRDPEHMAGLWPSSAAGRVLVTTSAGPVQTAAQELNAMLVPVPVWDQREALAYLSDRLVDREQRTGALDLVSQAGMTEPAALAAAAAVITATGMSCRDYRGLFTKRQERLAGGGMDASAAEVTWRLSVDYAESHAGGSWPLLVLAAVLGSGPVPAALLTGPAACRYLAGQLAVPGTKPARLRELLLVLERCGLVTVVREATGAYVLTGRDVAARARAAARPDMLADAARTAADALAGTWPSGSQRDWLPAAMRSCAAALRRHAGDLLWADGGCHGALTAAGHSLEAAGMTGPACSWWRDLAGDAGRLAGPPHTHQVTLTLNAVAATAMLAAGDAAGGLEGADAVARGCAIVYGPGSVETLTARIGYGRALTAVGKAGDAATVLEETAADCERLLPAGDDLVLSALEEYGAACLASGNTAGAVQALQTVLSRREAVASGPGGTRADARVLYEAAARLAGAYQAGGNAEVAVGLWQQVAAGREALLGDEHPGTLRARSSLAAAYMAAGQFGEALRLLRQVCARYEQTAGPGHPDTLTALGELAAAHGAAGQLGDAVTLLRDAIARAGSGLSPADPVTLALRGALAQMADA